MFDNSLGKRCQYFIVLLGLRAEIRKILEDVSRTLEC